MREIKFRAWWNDTGNKVEDFNNEYIIDACNDEVFTVEQFTGLHDKNGKEIYEGDIVRQPVLLSGEMVENPVKWIDCGFIANGLLGTRGAENCEVIGNIHENPELLEATK